MTPASRRSTILAVIALAVLVALVVWAQARPGQQGAGPTPPAGQTASTGPSSSKGPVSPRTSPSVRSHGLPLCGRVPAEVATAVAAVRAGGPYLRPRADGQTFANRERLLPRQPSGYYREYTVAAPGQSFPGPRRLVTGGQSGPGTEPQLWYYTADHYESFCQLQP